MAAAPLLPARIAMLALLLAGCDATSDRTAPPAAAPTFTAEDRRVAMMLSLGAATIVGVSEDPRREAALCRVLLGELRQKLADGGALTQQLAQGFVQVDRIYARRLGTGAVPSGEALARDLTPEARASAAVGCLERVQYDR